MDNTKRDEAIAAMAILRHKRNELIAKTAADAELKDLLRARLWHKHQPGSVVAYRDGRMEIPPGVPLGVNFDDELDQLLRETLNPD
jgi:hypothetical protein